MITHAESSRIAHDLHVTAEVPPFDDPIWLALSLGETRPLVKGEPSPMRRIPGCFYYPYNEDPRVRGEVVYRMLASRLLQRQTHSSEDEEMLAMEIALPESSTGGLTVSELLVLQPNAPVSWIQERCSGVASRRVSK